MTRGEKINDINGHYLVRERLFPDRSCSANKLIAQEKLACGVTELSKQQGERGSTYECQSFHYAHFLQYDNIVYGHI